MRYDHIKNSMLLSFYLGLCLAYILLLIDKDNVHHFNNNMSFGLWNVLHKCAFWESKKVLKMNMTRFEIKIFGMMVLKIPITRFGVKNWCDCAEKNAPKRDSGLKNLGVLVVPKKCTKRDSDKKLWFLIVLKNAQNAIRIKNCSGLKNLIFYDNYFLKYVKKSLNVWKKVFIWHYVGFFFING